MHKAGAGLHLLYGILNVAVAGEMWLASQHIDLTLKSATAGCSQ